MYKNSQEEIIIMSNIIASIKSKLDNPIKYRVVFDVDDVLCCSPMSLDFDLKHDKESFLKKRLSDILVQ